VTEGRKKTAGPLYVYRQVVVRSPPPRSVDKQFTAPGRFMLAMICCVCA